MSIFVADLGSISAQFKQAQDILDQLLATTIHEKTEAEQAIQNSRVQQARQTSQAEALLTAVHDLTARDKETQATVNHLFLERDARDADLKQAVMTLFAEKEMKDFEMREEVEGLLAESTQAHRRMEEAIVLFSAATSPASEVSGPLDAHPSAWSISGTGSPVVPLDIPPRADETNHFATPLIGQPTDDSWVVCESSLPVEAESSQAGEPAEQFRGPTDEVGRPAEEPSPAEEDGRPAEENGRPAEENGRPAEESTAPTDKSGAAEELPGDETIPIEPLDLICSATIPSRENHSNKGGSFPSVILAHVHDEAHFGISVKTSPNSDGDVRLQQLERDMSVYYSMHPVQAENFVPALGHFVSVHYDDSWHRGEITLVSEQARHARVRLLDYGHDRLVAFHQMRSMQTRFRSLPCQSRNVCLSFVDLVSKTHIRRHQAISRLRELCEGRELRATVEYREHSKLYVSLSDPKTTDFSAEINSHLVREGFASLRGRVGMALRGRPQTKKKYPYSLTTMKHLTAASEEYQRQQSMENRSIGGVN